MRILNATTKQISIMTDRNELLSVAPGEMSTLFVGSKNIVLAAIKLGTPEEIGIVVGSTYELDIARSVSTSLPYLHMTEDEAIAKLIDKDKDYKSRQVIGADSMKLELQKKDEEIANLKNEKAELEKKIADSESKGVDEVVSEYKSELKAKSEQIQKLESDIEELKASEKISKEKLESAESTIADRDGRIAELTKDNEQLILDLGTAKSQLETPVDVKETEEYKALKSTVEELEKENETLRSEGAKVLEKVEAMKSDFNACCLKFGITKDSEGNWVMESKE